MMTVSYLHWFLDKGPSEKGGRQCEAYRQAELHASFESGRTMLCASPVSRQVACCFLNPWSL